MKINDVFDFRYNEKELKERFMLNHCFDGQLIVRQGREGKLILHDTFWGINNGESRQFEIEEAEKLGSLKFVTNLDDVEKIQEWEVNYYADEDVFNLSYQHGCYKFFVKKNGAKKSKDKMLSVIQRKIAEKRNELNSLASELEQLSVKRHRIENGDLSVFF